MVQRVLALGRGHASHAVRVDVDDGRGDLVGEADAEVAHLTPSDDVGAVLGETEEEKGDGDLVLVRCAAGDHAGDVVQDAAVEHGGEVLHGVSGDVADLFAPDVFHPDRVAIVRVIRLPHQRHLLLAADDPVVILDADDVGFESAVTDGTLDHVVRLGLRSKFLVETHAGRGGRRRVVRQADGAGASASAGVFVAGKVDDRLGRGSLTLLLTAFLPHGRIGGFAQCGPAHLRGGKIVVL